MLLLPGYQEPTFISKAYLFILVLNLLRDIILAIKGVFIELPDVQKISAFLLIISPVLSEPGFFLNKEGKNEDSGYS